MSKTEWIEKMKIALKEKKEVSLVWVIGNYDIEIKEFKAYNNMFLYRIFNSMQGSGNTEITVDLKNVIGLLESHNKPHNKPDMIFIDGKEVK